MPDFDIQCVEFTGLIASNGYGRGQVQVGPQTHPHPAVYEVGAHVAAFMNTWGPVPKGMIVRHTCDNPPCINPMHLQLGTQGDNMRDRYMRGRDRSFNRAKTHCRHGHPFDEANTYVTPRGHRVCRPCRRVNAQRSRRKATQ